MVDLEQFPLEMQDKIKGDIAKHGEWATSHFIYLAPLWKMISGLRNSDSDMVWLATTCHVINFFSAEDPSPVHFAIARDVLDKKQITDNRAVDILARRLVTACKDFQQTFANSLPEKERDLLLPFLLDKDPMLPERDYQPDHICELDGCNLADLLFSDLIKTIGKAGEKSAKKIRSESQKKYKIFKESGFNAEQRSQFWQLWVDKRDGKFSILSDYLSILTKTVWEDSAKREWMEKTSEKSLQKIPVNLFNIMLTTKESTLTKLQKRINEFRNKILSENDPKRKPQLKKQLGLAIDLHQKASLNFPEDYRFSVYEQYAIYGAFKLLNDNKFNPTEFYLTDILEALRFDKINKKEITEIRKALQKLTKQKFPCYMVYPNKKDPNKYDFYDGDEPIFKIWELGTLDLNTDLLDVSIVKKKLFISLANPGLLNNLNNFYAIINSDLLAQLRQCKKVSEEDLYFLAFLLREMRFAKKSSSTTLHKLCAILKKTDWLCEGKITDRNWKRRIKNKVILLLTFAKKQGLVAQFSIEDDEITITYRRPSKEIEIQG